MDKNAVKDTFFCQKTLLNCKGTLLDIRSPLVMGILNITPDSFYQGSRYAQDMEIIAVAEKMLQEGASIIDIGGYSTRPGAESVSEEEELVRTIPVIKALVKALPGILISIDTFRSKVAVAAVSAGAGMINDISGGTIDDQMFATVAALNVPYILMHIKGTPQTMQQNPQYKDVVEEVLQYFIEKTSILKKAGVKDIIIDPGFGFGKMIAHNYTLLKRLTDLKILGYPILTGLSRKGMIYKTLETIPDEALNGTTVLNTIALLNGACVLRVHDVKAAVEAVKLVSTLQKNN